MAERNLDTTVFDWKTPVDHERLPNGKFKVITVTKDELVVDCLEMLQPSRFAVRKIYNKWHCLNDEGEVSEEWRRYIERQTRPNQNY